MNLEKDLPALFRSLSDFGKDFYMSEASVIVEEVSSAVVDVDVAPPVEAAPADAPPKSASKPKGFEDIDSVLKALVEQDEMLKLMKQQISDMLATNSLLKKSIKQIVQDSSKNDELLAELNATKKKLHVIKQFLG
jgi:septal ring factor EnvC (AmiA/AmiB activator)